MPDLRPDPDHDAVLASTARHVVVTAPPGTGKTCLSVRLAASLVPSLPREACVLLLTFSNQARTQLEREAARHLPSEFRRRIEVTNYHRFFWRGVLAYRRALGLPMRVDIGSRRRRQKALETVGMGLVKALAKTEGLIESLAEHAFPAFRDQRTPGEAALGRLLPIVLEEQRAGRLVFDDLGVLFWSLLERFPSVDQAYRARYPVVIADEHQDASALQDAVIRRLGSRRLVVLADPMQLIHEFRGASQDRLDRHLAECNESLTLGTPHRWHGNVGLAEWLLAVRSRLRGAQAECLPPAQLRLDRSPANRGFIGMKARVKYAVSRAFKEGATTVAVLARTNDLVADLRSYLSREGLYPRQIGTGDFEDARVDIEQLPLLQDPQGLALHAVERLVALVPTLSAPVVEQVKKRLLPDQIDLHSAGKEARLLLHALQPMYGGVGKAYFCSVVAALEACAGIGHHLPRGEAVRALRQTAAALESEPANLDEALDRYASAVLVASHIAPRMDRGLFIMTTHQAKGKEFDVVILADAMERYWPDTDESRRLFYVALTRASKSWTLVAPDQRESTLLRYLIG